MKPQTVHLSTVHYNLKDKRTLYQQETEHDTRELYTGMISMLAAIIPLIPYLLILYGYFTACLLFITAIFVKATQLYTYIWQQLALESLHYKDLLSIYADYMAVLTAGFGSCLLSSLSLYYNQSIFDGLCIRSITLAMTVIHIILTTIDVSINCNPYITNPIKHFFSCLIMGFSLFNIFPNLISIGLFCTAICHEKYLHPVSAFIINNRLTLTLKTILNPQAVIDTDIQSNYARKTSFL